MPTLEIYNFANVSHKILEIDDPAIVLLNGDSGIGKTTIFNALIFVYYDHMGTSCYPRDADNTTRQSKTVNSTYVKLTYPDGTIIYRQKRKDSFIVYYNGITYNDDQASELIYKLYGSMNLFLSSCYLAQDDKWFFLNLKNSEKLAVLQEIADSDPQYYEKLQATCNQKLHSTFTKISDLNTQYQLESSLYQDNLSRLHNQMSTTLWSDDLLKTYIDYFQIPNGILFENYGEYVIKEWGPRKLLEYDGTFKQLQLERDVYLKDKNEQQHIITNLKTLENQIHLILTNHSFKSAISEYENNKFHHLVNASLEQSICLVHHNCSNIDQPNQLCNCSNEKSFIIPSQDFFIKLINDITLKVNKITELIFHLNQNHKKTQLLSTINILQQQLKTLDNFKIKPELSLLELQKIEKILSYPISLYEEKIKSLDLMLLYYDKYAKYQLDHKIYVKEIAALDENLNKYTSTFTIIKDIYASRRLDFNKTYQEQQISHEKEYYVILAQQNQFQNERLSLEQKNNHIFKLEYQYNKDISDHQNKIKTITQMIEETQKKSSNLERDIINLNSELSEYHDFQYSVENDIHNFYNEKALWDITKNKHECPSCKTYLYFDKNKLVILPTEIPSETEMCQKIKILTNHEDKYKKRKQILTLIDTYKSKKNSLINQVSKLEKELQLLTDKNFNNDLSNIEHEKTLYNQKKSELNQKISKTEEDITNWKLKADDMKIQYQYQLDTVFRDEQSELDTYEKNKQLLILEIIQSKSLLCKPVVPILPIDCLQLDQVIKSKEIYHTYIMEYNSIPFTQENINNIKNHHEKHQEYTHINKQIINYQQQLVELSISNLVVDDNPTSSLPLRSNPPVADLNVREQGDICGHMPTDITIVPDRVGAASLRVQDRSAVFSATSGQLNQNTNLLLDDKQLLENLEFLLKHHQLNLDTVKQTETSYNLLQNEIIKYKKLLKNIIPFDENLIIKCKSDIEGLNLGLQSWLFTYQDQLTIRKLNKIINTCQSIQDQILKENQRYQQFSKIKNIIMTSEYFIIDTILSRINKKVNKILENIFTEPIYVELRAVRQLKSDNRLKPEVNISITHNGNTFTNLNALSGGQKHRIYIAFILAFFKMKKYPFLLLDECIYSVGPSIKGHMLDILIDKFISHPNIDKHRLIMIILHDTDTDPYTQIINV